MERGNGGSGIVSVACTLAAGACLPEYASEWSSGADLHAAVEKALVLEPGSRALVPTGLCIQIPAGYEGQVRARSGHAHRSGVTVLNAPGTIDADYRGEVKVFLVNLGQEAFTVHSGDRIAQLVICPVARARFRSVSSLETSARGTGGFGSTGL